MLLQDTFQLFHSGHAAAAAGWLVGLARGERGMVSFLCDIVWVARLGGDIVSIQSAHDEGSNRFGSCHHYHSTYDDDDDDPFGLMTQACSLES